VHGSQRLIESIFWAVSVMLALHEKGRHTADIPNASLGEHSLGELADGIVVAV